MQGRSRIIVWGTSRGRLQQEGQGLFELLFTPQESAAPRLHHSRLGDV